MILKISNICQSDPVLVPSPNSTRPTNQPTSQSTAKTLLFSSTGETLKLQDHVTIQEAHKNPSKFKRLDLLLTLLVDDVKAHKSKVRTKFANLMYFGHVPQKWPLLAKKNIKAKLQIGIMQTRSF